MTPAEREAVAELLVAVRGVLRADATTEMRARLATEHDIVDALLAAPVTEPASVAELREAIREERSAEQDYRRAHRDPDGSLFVLVSAAREHVDAILARLGVTGPVAQRGEADEESAAREVYEREHAAEQRAKKGAGRS